MNAREWLALRETAKDIESKRPRLAVNKPHDIVSFELDDDGNIQVLIKANPASQHRVFPLTQYAISLTKEEMLRLFDFIAECFEISVPRQTEKRDMGESANNSGGSVQ